MDAFYSTIFVAVLALFGLLVAALIYVAQTVQDRYSTKLAQRLLKGRLSLSFWFFGLLTLLWSSVGLFVLAYQDTPFFSVKRTLYAIIKNPWNGLATLLGVFLTLLFFILTLRRYAQLLSPLTVLDEMSRDLTPRAVRDMALFRFHRTESNYAFEWAQMQGLLDELKVVPDAVQNVNSRAEVAVGSGLTGLLPGRLLGSNQQRLSQIERIKTTFRAKESAGKLEDPLADLFEYGLSAVEKNNALAWRAFLRRLVDVFGQSARLGLLNQDSEIPFFGDAMLIQGLERLREEIDIAQRYSLFLQLSDAIKEIIEAFASVNSWRRLPSFLTFLQDVGARSLDRRDSAVFESCVRVTTTIGIISVMNEAEAEVFDDACRKMGWLGEKLILRGIEDSPIMPSGNETEELGAIIQGIYELSDAVREGKTDKYPLILRDAIEVICDQALRKNEPKKFEDTLLNLFGIHVGLARHLIAIASKNAEAYLWLVLNYFKSVLRRFDLTGYRELRKDIFTWVGNVATETMAHNQDAPQFGEGQISGKRDLQGMIIAFMAEVGASDDWDAAMWNVFTKSHKHMHEAWEFVKRAGVELHSNFGLMFDSDTGADYAKDDPRRR